MKLCQTVNISSVWQGMRCVTFPFCARNDGIFAVSQAHHRIYVKSTMLRRFATKYKLTSLLVPGRTLPVLKPNSQQWISVVVLELDRLLGLNFSITIIEMFFVSD